MIDKHYDIGVFGVWCGCNYGSIATYYALHQVLTGLGKSVLMIDKPKSNESDVEHSVTHSRRFGLEHYEISPCYTAEDFYKLNELCDCFVIGSDQVWNYGISQHTGYLMYLDFASDDKLKISYSSSLGHGVDFAPKEERIKIAKYLSRFDGISVREKSGVELLDQCYGINAVQVLDPVFLPDPKIFADLADKSKHRESEPFLATYILDPTPQKRAAILHISEKLGGIKIINLLDGLPWKFKKNVQLMDLPNCVENLQVEDWLYYISHCEFLITDSCHGASFAIIFRRRFVAISNKSRGHTRFVSLLENFQLSERLVVDPTDLLNTDHYLKYYDNEKIDQIMQIKSSQSISWLKSVLSSRKKSNEELRIQNVKRDISLEANADTDTDHAADLVSKAPPVKFLFDPSVWERHTILGYTTLIPVDSEPKPRNYAFCYFDTSALNNKKISAGNRYRVTMGVKYHTSSKFINFHLYSEKNRHLQIVYRHKTSAASMNKWLSLDITFEADRSDYTCLMVGAMQISGENRFIAFRNIIIQDV
jgi:hypothetical protein